MWNSATYYQAVTAGQKKIRINKHNKYVEEILSGTLNYFLKCWFFSAQSRCLALFLGKRGPPCENIDRDLHFAPVVGPFRPLQKFLKNRDLQISKISNIDEVDRIYMASPRGLSGGKTEPPDYILMFSSANVPGITYKINFGDFLSSIFEKNDSSTKITME